MRKVSVKLPYFLYLRLEKYAVEKNMSISEVVRKAIQEYFDRREA